MDDVGSGTVSSSRLPSRITTPFPQLTMGLAWFLVYWKWRPADG